MASIVTDVVIYLPNKKEGLKIAVGKDIIDILITHDGNNRGIKVVYEDFSETLFYNLPFVAQIKK